MKQASKIIMRNFILLTSLSIISSCEQPFAKIKVTDEKSKIIEKIFQEVSAENTDYIEEAFSDEMKMVNPKKVDLTFLPSGQYILKIGSDDIIKYDKIIKI